MRTLLTLLIIAVTFTQCSKPGSTKDTSENTKGLTESGKKANLDNAKKFGLISVEIGATKEQLAVDQEHLYGKFFNDRAEFYILENPELYISNSLVNRLTLYFIDGTLCKKKYELDNDISQELMKSYGGFRFKALNDTTSKLAKTEKIILKSDSGTTINNNLNRFEMKWEDDGVAIKYMVFKDSIAGQLQLMEELLAYKNLLRAAELEI